jgi:molecular chaperone DnaK (HSP70)
LSNEPPTFDPLIDQLPSRYVVGIDLGTTNSAVTYIDTSKTHWNIKVLSIPQSVSAEDIESRDTLPSFHFQPVAAGKTDSLSLPWDKTYPNYCVGSFARDQAAKTPGRGIASAKSWLSNTAVDRTAAVLPWQGAADVDRLSPVEVSSRYLKHIRHTWDHQFPGQRLEDQDIVLTLPASFDEVARELTVTAAADAGLKRVVLIEEPQASFYAWVYKHRDNWDTKINIGQKILVCDIGGGTTDFTLIRVRKSDEDADEKKGQVQFHRVAVGNHLILGGDNLDLAIAKFIEQKMIKSDLAPALSPAQWDVLVGKSRNVKETMLAGDSSPPEISVTLPGQGSNLIGGSLTLPITQAEIQSLVIDGFLPKVPLSEKPQQRQSGFQEFGLPYASDPAITRYLADFLTTHANAGAEDGEAKDDDASARPDVLLFNGGFFASPLLRDTVVQRIASWFESGPKEPWSPQVLENDRLDLAVARGAAYYGMVRRDQGVRIAASLARSYYIGVGDGQAICIMPGSAQAGQSFTIENQQFMLTISQPVEFPIYVSSVRLADQVGQIIPLDRQQLRPLPPIRTVLRVKSKNEKRDVAVILKVGLTEIGTITLSCHQIDSDRHWQLQFDVRSTTQTDFNAHQGAGESEGFIDEAIWQLCADAIEAVFSKSTSSENAMKPKLLIPTLTSILDSTREHWPMSVLRRIWESLMKHAQGRSQSAQHEARWLNLLGFSLRPGYGMAVDDWRVTETWRKVRNKLIHRSPNIQTESLILWRRLSGGLTAGQQAAIAAPLLASLRQLSKQMAGKPAKGNAVPIKPEDSIEIWRLLGSLELIAAQDKVELGNLILTLRNKPKLAAANDAMIWALGRLGQRTPIYAPLNCVLPEHKVVPWLLAIMENSPAPPVALLAATQISRRVDDRYRDLEPSVRKQVTHWLENQSGPDHLVELVRRGGNFGSQEREQVFGESLPPGLRIQ